MTPWPPRPQDVHVTHHAQRQLLVRFPHDLLPPSPDQYLRDRIARAVPLKRRGRRQPVHTLKPGTAVLASGGWILVLVLNDRSPTPPWVLVTVLRTKRAETQVPAALRAERVVAHSLFRSGTCNELLESLIAESGTHDLVTLERLWWERRYPLVLYGGYADFREFYRSARRPRARLSA